MNSWRRFRIVYAAIEVLYHRVYSELEIERAYKRYLNVTGEEPRP